MSIMTEISASLIDPRGKDLLLDHFKPRIAVVCSPAAEAVAQKNNLSFIQYIEPFCCGTSEFSWQEPGGQRITVQSFTIVPEDLGSWKAPKSDSTKNRRILANVVSKNTPFCQTKNLDDSFHLLDVPLRMTKYFAKVPQATPWFTEWRKLFLKMQSQRQQTSSQHDFMNHLLGSILVCSSSEFTTLEESDAVITRLKKVQQQHQYDWPQAWTFSAALRYFVIIHDVNSSVDMSIVEGAYQKMKTMYGANYCSFVKVNSSKTKGKVESNHSWSAIIDVEEDTMTSSDLLQNNHLKPAGEEILHPLSPEAEDLSLENSLNGRENKCTDYGCYMTEEDEGNLKQCFVDFYSKALFPFVERQAKILNESIMNRRGMSKSIFSATKRLFGTPAKTTSNVVYAHDSPEMQSRKLADIYFLFGNYNGAYQLYHQLKKDFMGDSAWLHCSSSLEMAAYSHFMLMAFSGPTLTNTRAFPAHYIGEAIGHYIDHCRLIDAATRVALLGCECLTQLNNHSEAAAVYIKLTSEDCDLRSALMLEQAASSFLKLNSPRKYAFHCVLAGHRFVKAGLKHHAINNYYQAAQMYNGRKLRLAEDHVNFTLARLLSQLQIHENVHGYLKSLFVTPTPQPPQQIMTFYKEFLTVISKYYETDPKLQEFFVPNVMFKKMHVISSVSDLIVGEVPLKDVSKNNTRDWEDLEEQVVRECVDSSVILFKPSRLFSHEFTDNTENIKVPVGEQFHIEIPFQNQLNISLDVKNLGLKFDRSDNIESSILPDLHIEPGVTKFVRFSVTSYQTGVLSLEYVYYELELGSLRVPFLQKVELKGRRLNSNMEERCSKIYAKDLRNKVMIVPKAPLLQANIENVSSKLMHGQKSKFEIILEDKSSSTTDKNEITAVIIACDNISNIISLSADVEVISKHRNFYHIKLGLTQCERWNIPCILNVPQQGVNFLLNLLIVYQFPCEDPSAFKYRVIQASMSAPLWPSLNMSFSSLKFIDAHSSLALLKLENLTTDTTFRAMKIHFSDPSLILEEIRCTSENGLELTPLESRNIIVKVQKESQTTLSSVYLSVNWKTSQGLQTEGESALYLQEKHSIFLTENSFVFQVEHAGRASHDFRNYPCFVYPVDMCIHSKAQAKVNIVFSRNVQDSMESDTGKRSQASSSEVLFVGQTSWVVDVVPKNPTKLSYKIAVTRPGIYNVAPQITISQEGTPGVAENYYLHSPIILVQS